MTKTIRIWLESDRQPADLYELLGKLRLDPDVTGLSAAIRARYADLLPYQNHEDRRVARRAVELQRELGRAEDTLSDPHKLQAHHEAVLQRLRDAYARAKEQGGPWTGDRLRSWLVEQAVHPARIEAVAKLLSSVLDETQTVAPHETQSLDADAVDAPRTGYVLEEPGTGITTTDSPGRQGPPPQQGSPSAPVPSAPVVPGRPAERKPRAPAAPGEAAGPASRFRRIGWGLAIGGMVILLLVILAVFFSGNETWRGELLQVRGHEGEVHLLVETESGSAGGRPSLVEAFTHDSRAGAKLADLVSADEASTLDRDRSEGPRGRRKAEGTRVILEGTRRTAAATRFRLDARPGMPLVELSSIRAAEERPRGGLAALPRTELAALLRIHPSAGVTTAFQARYGQWQAQGLCLYPSLSDRRPVVVEFAGKSAQDFAAYRPDDAVYVVAALSTKASPSRLVLRGLSIRRLEKPESPVTAGGG